MVLSSVNEKHLLHYNIPSFRTLGGGKFVKILKWHLDKSYIWYKNKCENSVSSLSKSRSDFGSKIALLIISPLFSLHFPLLEFRLVAPWLLLSSSSLFRTYRSQFFIESLNILNISHPPYQCEEAFFFFCWKKSFLAFLTFFTVWWRHNQVYPEKMGVTLILS